MASYIYRITWPDGSISDMDDAHEAVREIEERYPSAHVGSGAALADEVNLAAVRPDGHGCDWVSIYGEEGYRIQVQMVERASPAPPREGIYDTARMPKYLRAMLDGRADTLGEAWRQAGMDQREIAEAVRLLGERLPYTLIEESTPLRYVISRGDLFGRYSRDRMVRERQLQEEYDLSILESEVVAARESGMSNAAIARELGISPQSASNAMSKARAKGALLPVD